MRAPIIMRTATDIIFDNWHPVCAPPAPGAKILRTRLLDVPIEASAGPHVRRADNGEDLPVLERFGLVWTTLGRPEQDLFDVPEYLEPDRRNLSAGPIGVAASAPRAIENFLDLAHFPFVHTDILGAEPHTEVKDYEVRTSDDGREIVATGCEFFQPLAALTAAGGQKVDYIYRVPHPFCAVLYKSCFVDPSRMDVIAIFIQSMTQETIRAHLVMSMIDEVHSDTEMRRFQQMIFGQDKPILENQRPRRLPLDPRAETPIRADLSGIAYRRWLRANRVTYGVIPAQQ
jgi:phenylpropionate dioxygenase-like ring-hydroxylating dioxygenase large terminal subunit